jgi:serine/threonine protein kinase
MEPKAPEPSGALLGIEGVLGAVRVGQGSYGVVYKASQPAYGRTVAVKVLTSPLLDDDSQRRFERECRALGSLSSHPYIVTLHSAGVTADGHPYLIMDFLPGGSLASRLTAGPIGWQEVADIGVKLASALAAAHDAGILHRDIKPENVLVSAYGEPQLADFGVAKIQGGTSTTSATITGSLAHAAPEVISGVAATAASDIWSLSSTLATLMVGYPPFHRAGDETLHPLITRILTQAPPDMRPIGVPSAICELIEAGLAKDSWERPQTATDFGVALQDAQRSLGLTPTALLALPAPSVEASDQISVVETSPPDGASQSEPPTGPAVPPVVPVAPEPEPRPETATRRRGGIDTGPTPVSPAPEPPPRPVEPVVLKPAPEPPPRPVEPVVLKPAPPPSAPLPPPDDATGELQEVSSAGPTPLSRAVQFTGAHRRILIPIGAVAAVVLGLLLLTTHGSGKSGSTNRISVVPTTSASSLPAHTPTSAVGVTTATTSSAATTTTATTATTTPPTATGAAVTTPVTNGAPGASTPPPTAPHTTRATSAPTPPPTQATTPPTQATTPPTPPPTSACPPKVPNCH